jgi:hypothetical protein
VPAANFVVETLNLISDRFTDIVLPAGVDGASYNFGELKPSSVAGCVYIDVNNNGVRDPNETPIAGVDITITGIDDRGNVVNTTISTDLNGLYTFQNLRPANNVGYTLTQTHPVLFLDGKDKVGTAGGVAGALQPDADTITGILLGGCTAATGYCFGERGYIVPSKRPFIFTNGAWQNQSNALDVNADGRITGQDVLIVVNALNKLGIGKLPEGNGSANYPDVNGDQVLSPADVLQIVNQLNVQAKTATNGSNGSTAQGLLSDMAFSEMTSEADPAAEIATSLATPGNNASSTTSFSASSSSAGSSTSAQSSKSLSQRVQYSNADLVDIALGLASEYDDSPSEESLYDLVGAAF